MTIFMVHVFSIDSCIICMWAQLRVIIPGKFVIVTPRTTAGPIVAMVSITLWSRLSPSSGDFIFWKFWIIWPVNSIASPPADIRLMTFSGIRRLKSLVWPQYHLMIPDCKWIELNFPKYTESICIRYYHNNCGCYNNCISYWESKTKKSNYKYRNYTER